MSGPGSKIQKIKASGASSSPQTVAELDPSFIYCLCCPKTNEVRYIGKSNRPKKRLMQHISIAASGRSDRHQCQWVRSLLSSGLAPQLLIFFRVPREMAWQDAERFFIASAKSFGFDLTNASDGGGNDQIQTPEQTLSAKDRAVKAWADPEVRQRRVAALRQAHASPEGLQKKREVANRPTTKAKKSEALRAFYACDEAKAASSVHWKEVWSRPGMAEKKAAATKAAWADPIAAAKRSAAISEAKRIGWARRKAAASAPIEETLP